MNIIFISGLTGVGKSTTLKALNTLAHYVLLPNRRELTDHIIIPEILQDEGKENQIVKDRLERFRITAEYRQKHSSGIVHALQSYLTTLENTQQNFIFDNIRGLEECQATVKHFPNARIIFLDAPVLTRLERLIGRSDSFDHVKHHATDPSGLLEQLKNIDGIDTVFHPLDVANLKTQGFDHIKLLDAVAIIVAEQKNYNAERAAHYLKNVLGKKQLLYLDTQKLDIQHVAQHIEDWL